MDPIKRRRVDENGAAVPLPVAVAVAVADTESINMLNVNDALKILEPLTHDQILGVLQNAVLRHPDVLDAVRTFADRDVTQRKLFIRGLGWETSTEKLGAIFSSYGELDEAAVILDKYTGKSKGYGFITFKHIDGAIMALKEPSKKIDGRMTVTQLASAGVSTGGAAGVGGVGGASNPRDVSARKIYVSNVPYDMPSERLLQHFSMYGEIEEGPLGFDKATGKSKGFALFVYKTVEAARASLVDPIKKVDGHQLSCKLAVDGKRAKRTGDATGPTGFPGSNQGNGDGIGRAMNDQYVVAGGVGGPYGDYSGGLGVAGPANGLGSLAGLGGGAAGGYAGGYAGGSAVSGAGGASVGGAGRGSSLYGFAPTSGPMASGEKLGHYGLSSGGYHGPPNQPSGASKVRPGGGYQGPPPYY
ncbi:hypothetical protein M569_00327 [Genlisea aurea]|uniref:RRM domain-containing protein n=1 Tax=Genlisea aurea TaxID=192259 RepID=S8ENJ7_9LAMI|nr:hypothetical protein M569_00327 [Genlisea aurea]